MNPLHRCVLHAIALRRRPANAAFHLAGIKREAGTALAIVGALFALPVVAAAIVVTLSR